MGNAGQGVGVVFFLARPYPQMKCLSIPSMKAKKIATVK